MRNLTNLAPLVLLALILIMPAGCRPAAESSSKSETTSPQILLIEASGLAVRGDGKVAVVAGDETSDLLWAVALDDFSKRWELPFPAGTPPLNDLESLAPWGKDGLFAICSQSRTKSHVKVKPERVRLAFIALSPDARRILEVSVHEGFRDELIAYLAAQPRDVIQNTATLYAESPNAGGLNVEGAAAWQEDLLIGLRSPAAVKGAIVVPLRQPDVLLAHPGAPADFGPVMIVPAAPGEGIRDMAADGDHIIVLLGAIGDIGSEPRLIRWDPKTGETAEIRSQGLMDIANPEGIAPDPKGGLLVVQDQKPPLHKKIIFRVATSLP